ncbi:(2Fe-2S)-binding protein [Streptomyces sp. NBC_01343]|nr:(2Fe-2S)-binding protein [Streptomyces sp. NBC_01343]
MGLGTGPARRRVRLRCDGLREAAAGHAGRARHRGTARGARPRLRAAADDRAAGFRERGSGGHGDVDDAGAVAGGGGGCLRCRARIRARTGRRADSGLDPASGLGGRGVRGRGSGSRPGLGPDGRPGRAHRAGSGRGRARSRCHRRVAVPGGGPGLRARDHRPVDPPGTARGDRRVPPQRPGGRLEPGPGDAARRRGGPVGHPSRLRGRGGRGAGRGHGPGCRHELGGAARGAPRRAGHRYLGRGPAAARRPRRRRLRARPPRPGRARCGHPLPEAAEPEPVQPAPHDVEAAHGPASAPVTAERPHPGAEAAEAAVPADLDAERAAEREATPVAAAEYVLSGGPGAGGVAGDGDGNGGFGGAGAGAGGFAERGDTDGHGFTASGHGGAGAEPGPGGEHGFTAEPLAEPTGTDGRGFGTDGRGFGTDGRGFGTDGRGFGTGEAAGAPAPGEDTADIAGATPDGGTPEGFPGEVAAYEENATAEAVAHHEHPLASYVLRVNGADRPVTGAWIGESLLYVLRERLGLAGAKDGCSQGECGACAVQVDGRLVASCLVPAATAASSEVRTVEGLAAGGELSDVQQALCRSGAVQCGFCVPGMAMTIHDLLEGNHAPSELETRQALCGNLCRCSGYKGVIEAVREVVAERETSATADAPGTGTGTGSGSGAEARIPHQAPPGEGGIHHNGGMA